MKPESFCYWLQGWFELNTTVTNKVFHTPETLNMIEQHLKLVFKKEDLGWQMLDTRFTGVSSQPLC